MGLPEMNVLAVVDVVDEMLRVHVETRVARTGCERCGVVARVKERPRVELVDLPCFGRPTRLVWHKAPVVVPRGDLCDRQLDRGEPTYRGGPHGHERPGRPVGHRTGRTLRPERERGGRRARV